MSHFCVLVLTKEGSESEVTELLAPYDENNPTKAAKWDWWVIGGRWTGWLTKDYDPHEDERNKETCWLCDGTGQRNDALGNQQRAIDPAYTCNGCQGSGRSVKFETKWVAPPDNNRATPANLLARDELLVPFAVVTPDGVWHERGEMGWFATVTDEKDFDEWHDQVRALYEQHPDAIGVVVDCHI